MQGLQDFLLEAFGNDDTNSPHQTFSFQDDFILTRPVWLKILVDFFGHPLRTYRKTLLCVKSAVLVPVQMPYVVC